VHSKNSFRKDLKNMTDPEIVTYIRELLKALDSLHNKYGMTHRDIKPANFVHHFQTNTFRLIDLGLGKVKQVSATNVEPDILKCSWNLRLVRFFLDP
jgi:serine/threonine protein kinase